MSGLQKLRLERNRRTGSVRQPRLIFAIFAAVILFSMVREWSAPVACARAVLVPAVSNPVSH